MTGDPDAGPDVASFASTLIAWQRTHGRQTLPWQQLGASSERPRDAYRVWLAEIMLQQTQVAAVIPYYRRFLERFPDVRALADAPLDDVMQRWSGLGYYSRARNLHATARRIVDAFDGRFPDDVAVLGSLPGVGRSTAAAIAAFAYGRRAAILDGNVKRVLARLFGLAGAPATGDFTRRAWTIAEALLPDSGIERYTQGLMDLGATICTPRRPSCLICPFQASCIAHREGREAELPERATRKALPRRCATLVAFVHGDAVLLERRPPTGIWGGLWSLPEMDPDAIETVAADLGAVATVEPLAGFVHGFTHFVLEAGLVRVELTSIDARGLRSPPDATRWVAFAALDDVGLPAPIRTRLTALVAGRSPLQPSSQPIQRR